MSFNAILRPILKFGLLQNFILHLDSDGSKDDYYLVDRSLQALETSDWIHRTSSESSKSYYSNGVLSSDPDIIILAGDLNTEPGFFPYRVLTEYGCLTDSNGKFILNMTIIWDIT